MNIFINSELTIPLKEIRWRFSRSSGAGGQNLNKTESKVQLLFDIQSSSSLNDYQKKLILRKLRNKVINETIIVVSQEKRTQYQNRQLALMHLVVLIRKGLEVSPKQRKMTKPTRSSYKKRLDKKIKHGELKQMRKKDIKSYDF